MKVTPFRNFDDMMHTREQTVSLVIVKAQDLNEHDA